MDVNGKLYVDDPENIPEADKQRAEEWAKGREAELVERLEDLGWTNVPEKLKELKEALG